MSADENPNVDNGTDAVKGPPAEVTVTSPAGAEVTESTGAHPGPPPEVTVHQWPGGEPDKKQVKADEVQDKAVKRPKS